jgi:hypothetical protein
MENNRFKLLVQRFDYLKNQSVDNISIIIDELTKLLIEIRHDIDLYPDQITSDLLLLRDNIRIHIEELLIEKVGILPDKVKSILKSIVKSSVKQNINSKLLFEYNMLDVKLTNDLSNKMFVDNEYPIPKEFSIVLRSNEGTPSKSIIRNFYVVYAINSKGKVRFGWAVHNPNEPNNLELAKKIAIGRYESGYSICKLEVYEDYKIRTKYMVKQIVLSAINKIFYDICDRIETKNKRKEVIK